MKEGDQLIQKLKQQAELTIKLKAWWMLMAHTIFYGEGKKAGIREVVEWITNHSEAEKCDPTVMAWFEPYRWMDEDEWQAKLKQWGIEDENQVPTKP